MASLLVVFGAGIVRGFAGFGFSALCVAGLSLFMPPAQVVPPVFVLEVLASVSLLRGALKHADWRWLSWLVLGNVLCIPLGVALLAFVDETPLRLIIGALLLVAAALLRSGVVLALQPTPALRLVTGLVSGFVNGVAAIGGIAVAVLLSSSAMAPAVMRATLILMFLFTDLYALAWAASCQPRTAARPARRRPLRLGCGWRRPCWRASGSGSALSPVSRQTLSAGRC